MLRLILATCAFALVLAGCTSPAETSASLDREFSLRIGQTASFSGEGLKLRFAGIIGDSRCPTGAQCVWQGEVSATVQVSYNTSAYEMVLTQSGLTATPATAAFNQYRIEFTVLPYPAMGKSIDKGDYTLRMTVSRK